MGILMIKNIINRLKQLLVACLVDHLLLRNIGSYGIISMNVYVVITVAMLMLLRNIGSYGLIFMTMCVYYFRFSRHS
jgi:hypothetical protein